MSASRKKSHKPHKSSGTFTAPTCLGRLLSSLPRSTEPTEVPTKLLSLPAHTAPNKARLELGRQSTLQRSNNSSTAVKCDFWFILTLKSCPSSGSESILLEPASAPTLSESKENFKDRQRSAEMHSHQAPGGVSAPSHTVKPRGWKSIPARDEKTPQELLAYYTTKSAGLSSVKRR